MPLSHGERYLIRGFNWIPVLFMHLIAGWSYYAYVVKLCVYTVENDEERISYLVVFHVLFVMFTWSSWKTMFTSPAVPPKAFRLPKEEKERFEKAARSPAQHEILKRVAMELPVLTQTPGGTIRYCDYCRLIKPDRCHHCIRCETCVLKRDHHCPWVNNCVGFSNHKYFVLFIGYGILYCLVISSTSLKYFIKFATQQLPGDHAKLHVIFMFPMASMFFIGFLGFFSYHLWLVGKNRTTTEVYGVPVFRNGPDKNGFSLGLRQNVAEVFGDQKMCWLCPVFSSLGDGQSFGTRLVDIDPEQGMANGQQQWLEGGEEV